MKTRAYFIISRLPYFLVNTKTVDSPEGALLLAVLNPNILCYSSSSNLRGICARKFSIAEGIKEFKSSFVVCYVVSVARGEYLRYRFAAQ